MATTYDTAYVQAFADHLNKRSGQKGTAVIRQFLARKTPARIEDMQGMCKIAGLCSTKKQIKGRFIPTQWYTLGTPRVHGTKLYRQPMEYAHFFAQVLRDHTVFQLDGNYIKLHPRLQGLCLSGSTFVVQKPWAHPATRLVIPSPAAALPGRKCAVSRHEFEFESESETESPFGSSRKRRRVFKVVSGTDVQEERTFYM